MYESARTARIESILKQKTMELQDTLFQQNLRQVVLNQIAADHSISEEVIDAMKKIPRHYFVGEYQQEDAYEDKPLQIASGQTISQITTVAIQTELLKAKKGDRILEIGTGTGYQTAILHQLGCKVYSIERLKELYLLARKNLAKLGLETEITLIHGDGFEGSAQFAPFDGIVVTCATPEIPERLQKQLAVGGRMVVPVGDKVQEMKVVEKSGDNEYNIINAGFFNFVPMIRGVVD